MRSRGRTVLIAFAVLVLLFFVAWHFCFFQGCPDVHKLGAHVATIPFKVLGQLVKHPLTDSGLEKFLSDWKKSQKA